MLVHRPPQYRGDQNTTETTSSLVLFLHLAWLYFTFFKSMPAMYTDVTMHTHTLTHSRPQDEAFIMKMGADRFIDYTKDKNVFATVADDSVDVVYDNYGGAGTADQASLTRGC